jgi:aspartate aminotransferase
MALLRDEIETLAQNSITRVAFPRMDQKDIIPLWFGEGDSPTPAFICEAAREALAAGQTFYQHTRGRQDLRDAVAAYLHRLYGVRLQPDRVSVPGSAMLAMNISVQMALTTGSHGIIVGPAWPNVYNAMRVSGADITWVNQRLSDGRWQLDLAELRAALRPQTRAIFVNSPCNPTGWVMSADEQAQLLALAREREVLIISDEVYQRLVFDAEAAPSFLSIASDEDPVIVFSGFSKSWAMTGWRLGWMIAPARYATAVAAISECFNTGAAVFTQPAGIVALEQGEAWLAELKARYARGREMVGEILGDHPALALSLPEGAFYAFPRVPGLRSSMALQTSGSPNEATRPNAGAFAAEAAPDMDRPVKPRYVAGYVIVLTGCAGSGCGGRYCDGGSL